MASPLLSGDDEAAGGGGDDAALHTLLTSSVDGVDGVPMPEWREAEWDDLLRLGGDAFTRALQQAEDEIEQRAPAERMRSPTHREREAEAPLLDTNAFQQWAQRISHLAILDVDDASRDEDDANLTDQLDAAANGDSPSVAPSLASSAPEDQLLRYKLLLAQEEAKNVFLEDRVSRLQHELSAERMESATLRQSHATLSARLLQQVANSNSCSSGCGLVRLDNDKLQRQNKTLKRNLATLDHQMTMLMAQLEQTHQTQRAAASAVATAAASPIVGAQTRLRSHTGEEDASSSAPPVSGSPIAYVTPNHAFSPFSPTSRDASWAPAAPAPAGVAVPSDGASAGSGASLLRVRAALALARVHLQHQNEVDHLLQYKVGALALQTRVDDVEASLDLEREQLAAEREAHAKTKVELEAKCAEEQALQQVVATLAQKLHRHVGSQGLSVSMSPSPAPLPAAACRTDALDDGTMSGSGVSIPQSHVTPLKRQPSGASLQPHASATPSQPQAAPVASPSGGSGWVGWMFGGGSSSKQAQPAQQAPQTHTNHLQQSASKSSSQRHG